MLGGRGEGDLCTEATALRFAVATLSGGRNDVRAGLSSCKGPHGDICACVMDRITRRINRFFKAEHLVAPGLSETKNPDRNDRK